MTRWLLWCGWQVGGRLSWLSLYLCDGLAGSGGLDCMAVGGRRVRQSRVRLLRRLAGGRRGVVGRLLAADKEGGLPALHVGIAVELARGVAADGVVVGGGGVW
ncbi:hypothetical protein AAW14_36985 [Streptomyces hygroscopicus]|nr:hypothetical protein [Streptomyces hygroscopicus]